ncbi:MAG TPA: hypothetical protein VH575_18145 [Gemmataceae bacterium]|jgi:hypothetical protein
MDNASLPRDYPNWRTNEGDRAEDAAYLFGYYLILHCRDKALETVPADASPDMKDAIEKAVDTALHNVCDLLEGFWPLEAGAKHRIALALGVEVRDVDNKVVETAEISPCKLDLPIGYWKWAQDREFR